MNKKVKIFAIAALIIAILLILFAAVKILKIGNTAVNQEISAGVPVETVTAKKRSVAREISYVGTVEAWEEVDISPKISSRIISISGREGELLNKGQVAVLLESNELEGKIKTLEKKVQTAKINLDYWDQQVERIKYLFNEGALAEQEYDKAKFSRDTALSGYEEAKAALSEAIVTRQNSVITSPMTGIITTVFGYPGDLAVPGKPILKVADISRLKIKVKVMETDLIRITEGTPVNLIPGQGSASYRASVRGIYPSLDRNIRTGTVEVDIPADMLQNNNLKPGMSSNVCFILEEKQDTLVVPKQTVKSENGTSFVFTVKDGKAVKKVVKTGISNADYIEITEGLDAGQPVISTGLEGVTDGTDLYIN